MPTPVARLVEREDALFFGSHPDRYHRVRAALAGEFENGAGVALVVRAKGTFKSVAFSLRGVEPGALPDDERFLELLWPYIRTASAAGQDLLDQGLISRFAQMTGAS